MSLSPSMIVLTNDLRAAGVAILDPAGNQLSGFNPSRPSVAATTVVPASATSVLLLASNPARRRFTLYNNSSKTLYVGFGATVTIATAVFPIAGQQVYTGVLDDYTGDLAGIWSAANPGDAHVTEIS